MNEINFFKNRKGSPQKKKLKNPLSRSIILLSFLVLSIFRIQSQSAPNVSYASPQNYLWNAAITTLAPVNSGGSIPALTYKQVSTFAGTTTGFLDATGTAAKMNGPLGMTMDTDGNVYFVDSANFRIRKMTSAGVVSTIAGDGYSWLFSGRWKDNAVGTTASFNWPAGLVFDATNNCLYVADKENDRIRKISLTGTYAVTTLAGSGASSTLDGAGTSATFKKPTGIAIDPTRTYLYVTDRTGNKIRRITIGTAQVLTIAGSGIASTVDNVTGTSATFNDPTGIAVDANFIYISDFAGSKIRKIAITTPFAVTTFAGSGIVSSLDGTGIAATFDTPFGITLDGAGNLFVTEWGNKIRKITPAGIVTTIAGSGTQSSLDGNGTAATFDGPANMIINPTTGVGYVSEWTGDRIRKIELGGYTLSPALPSGLNFDILTGSITGTPTDINYGPLDYTITAYNYYGSSTATVAITTANIPHIITTVASALTNTTATTGGTVTINGGSTLLEKGICWSTSANPTILDTKIVNGTTTTGSFISVITGLAPTTTYYVRAYATNSVGITYGTQVSFTTLITPPSISYTASNTFIINTPITALQVSNTGGAIGGTYDVSLLAGSMNSSLGYINSLGTNALFNNPWGVATDSSGNIYVADTDNNAIRKITPSGLVSTLAGGNSLGYADDLGEAALFNKPHGIATDAAGNVYVSDTDNNRIRKIDALGNVTTLAGDGSTAALNSPKGIAVDGLGNIYVADNGNHIIKKITASGIVTTLAGSGVIGSNDGIGISASFRFPYGVALDSSGNVYVADSANHRVRKITPDGLVTTLAGSTAGFANGTGTAAQFNNLCSITTDSSGNVFVADTSNQKIRKITPAGLVSTVAGSSSGFADGTSAIAQFNNPVGIASDAAGNLFVAELSHKIRKLTPSDFSVSPALPSGLVLNADGSITGTPTMGSAATNYVFTATNAGGSSTFAVSIAVITNPTLSTKIATSITSTSSATGGTINSQLATVTASGVCYSTSPMPTLANSFTTDALNEIFGFSSVLNSFTSLLTGLVPGTKYYYRAYATNSAGTGYGMEYTFTTLTPAPLISIPTSVTLTVNTAITPIVVTNTGGAVPNFIREVSTLAGSISGYTDGITNATFTNPTDVVKDSNGNLFVTDSSNNAIRKITPSGTVSTFAGGNAGYLDGIGTEAQFYNPKNIAIDTYDNLYISDSWNNSIRKITPSGIVSTLAGDGSTTIFNQPKGLTLDALGNVYVADYSHNMIKKITPTGIVSTYFSAQINLPVDVAFNSEGVLYVCQEGTQNSVVKCTFSTGIPTPFGYQYAIGPLAIFFDKYDTLYLSNNLNLYNKKLTDSTISLITNSFAVGTTDGPIGSAKFNKISGMTIDNDGVIYAADQLNNRIRRINLYGYATPGLPAGLALNTDGSITGTPIESTYTSTFIDAYNGGGTSSSQIYITVQDKPTVQTIDAIHVLSNYADSGVTIISDNQSTITTMGVCWSTSINPTIANNLNSTSVITQVYFPISGLSPSTTYYYRAFATNGVGTGYGNELSFTTSASTVALPVITYNASNTFTANSPIVALTVSNIGGAVQSYSISPALPLGLVLNEDGSITGTPTMASAVTDYVVTATNASGSSSFTISITVEGCTNPIITITTPESVCEGYGIELFSSTSAPIKNNFTGGYAVSNWVLNNNNTDGSIDTSNTPTSISITSGDNGTNTIGYSDYTITIPENAIISFNYDYSTNDDAENEVPFIIINGVSRLFYGFDFFAYDDDQFGSISVSVLAGDVFTFRMRTNNNYGTAAVVISNFQIAPSLLWTASNGGTIFGSNNNPMVEISTTGTYTVTATSGACSTSNSIDVIFNPSTSNITEVSACDSYTWLVDGATYSDSGYYTFVTGCNTETLNLTITPSATNTSTASACDSYTWSVNGTTYTTSGIYTSITDCNTETLNLTITPSATNTSTASACDSYTWSVNGTTYTTSGIYTSITDCNTETLNLTITPSATNTSTASACDSYTWSVNGTTYTTSGIYTSITDCNTDTLNLTITPSATNTSTASACDSYTWSVNGTTYTTSGIYTSITDCNTETLNLTITPSATNTSTASACDSYTWSVNGTTYTTSGIYTSINGCNTDTLNLTINTTSSSSETVAQNNSYLWIENGQTYTQSGIYTNDSTNTSGCIHTATLNLTITTSAPLTFYADIDGDGYGNAAASIQSVSQPIGYVANNTDCDDATAATHPGAIDICYDGIDNDCNGVIDNVGQPGGCIPMVSSLSAGSCGATVSGLNASISATFSTGAQGFRFRVTKVDMNTNVPLTAPVIVDRSVANFSLSSVLAIAYSSKYQIEVAVKYNNVYQPYYSAPCYVTTGNQIVTVGSQCGTTLTSLNQWINATIVPQVGAYKFRVTQLNSQGTPVGASQEFISGMARFNMNQFIGVLYSTPYSVEVSLRNTDLNYLPFNAPCTVTTPAYPTAQVRDAQCDGYVVTNNTNYIYADVVNGANAYRFRVFLVDGSNAVIYDYSYDSSFNRFTLNNFPGLVAGTTYTVQVAAKMTGQVVFGPFNKQCTIMTPGASKLINSKTVLEIANVFEAKAHPNPFATQFTLEVKTNNESVIDVKVYDMLGKLVEQRTIIASEIQIIEVGAQYPTGIYNVIVSQEDVTKTLRMIKR